MPEMGTSGLMSGDGKRAARLASVLAPILDSTDVLAVCNVFRPDRPLLLAQRNRRIDRQSPARRSASRE